MLVPVALVALAGLALAVAVARLERRAVALLVAGALLAGLGVLVAAGPGAGTGQDIVVRVTASPEGQAFVRGRAVVSAEAFGCPPNICGVETDSEVIRLRR